MSLHHLLLAFLVSSEVPGTDTYTKATHTSSGTPRLQCALGWEWTMLDGMEAAAQPFPSTGASACPIPSTGDTMSVKITVQSALVP